MGPADGAVVCTGVGVVSPLGIGKAAFWRGLVEGRRGIAPLSLFEAGEGRWAAELKDFSPEELLGAKGLRLLDRLTRIALTAAALALQDAGLAGSAPERTGVVLSSTCGSPASRSAFYLDALEAGFRGLNPALFANTVVNSPASQVAIRFGLRGPNATVAAGFGGGVDALEYAADLLRAGRAEVILAGGAEELGELAFHSFERAGFCAPPGAEPPPGPYARGRRGGLLGEGGAVLVLETAAGARRRGAAPLAEYAGGAAATAPAAYGRYDGRGRALATAVRGALLQSRTAGADITWVAAGANGALVGDAAEARVLRAALGAAPAVSASKGALGETFSAGAAFQAATAVLGLAHGEMPPTAGVETVDRRCQVDLASGRKTPGPVLITADGPLGSAAAAVLRPVPGAGQTKKRR